MTTENPKTVDVFYSYSPSFRMHTPKGLAIHFVDGRYFTKDPSAIEFLKSEIAAGSQYVFQKEGEEQMLEEDMNPLEVMKKRIIAEFLADQKKLAESGGSAQPSKSDPANAKLTPVSTADIKSILAK